jgi:hypothetical protein
VFPVDEYRKMEHRQHVARAELLGPHLAELELLRRRQGGGTTTRRLRQAVGAVLVATGTWLRGEPLAEPARPDLTEALGAGR